MDRVFKINPDKQPGLAKYWDGKESLNIFELLRLRNRFPDLDPDTILQIVCQEGVLSRYEKKTWRDRILRHAKTNYGWVSVSSRPPLTENLELWKIRDDVSPENAKKVYGDIPGDLPEFLPLLFVTRACTRPFDELYLICQDIIEAVWLSTVQNFNAWTFEDRRALVIDWLLDVLADVIEYGPSAKVKGGCDPRIDTVHIFWEPSPVDPNNGCWKVQALDKQGVKLWDVSRQLHTRYQNPRADTLELESCAARLLDLWGRKYKIKIDMPAVESQGLSFNVSRLFEQSKWYKDTETDVIHWITWDDWGFQVPNISVPGRLEQTFAVALIDSNRRVVRDGCILEEISIGRVGYGYDKRLYFDTATTQRGVYPVTLGGERGLRVGVENPTKDGYKLLLIPIVNMTGPRFVNPLTGDVIDADWVDNYLNP